MTKKDFEKFAEMFKLHFKDIKESYLFGEDGTWTGGREVELNRILTNTIKIFMENNKNFSPSRFREACQPKGK